MATTAHSWRRMLPSKADLARVSPGRDLLAGLTVAIVALPLALAFGEASGLTPQAGVTTAIIAGIIAAVFGGSNVQISGPTGAMTVVLIPVVYQFGPAGLLQVGVMAGIILMLLAVSRIGRAVRLLPTSLIEGFTAGIAVVITLQQVPNILGVGVEGGGSLWEAAAEAVAGFVAAPNVWAIGIALGVAAVIVVGARWKPAVPLSLLAVAAATALNHALGAPLAVIGEMPHGIPAPSAGFLSLETVPALLPSALAVAALAALESLLCATVADAMTIGEQHDPDRELLGQGLANLVVPFFGGVPATAAIARTAVNVRAGARSRLASVSHSLILLLFILLLAPLVEGIPLAALGGVLLATSIGMVQAGAVRGILRSSRADAAVLIVTFVVTVAVDLVTAVVVGFVLAAMLALAALARSSELRQVPLTASGEGTELDPHSKIVAYRIDGPLFFGAAHRFLLELTQVSEVSVVIIRMSRVPHVDATGASMLDDAIARLERKGIVVLLSGLRPGHGRVLGAASTLGRLRAAGRVFEDTPQALEYAHALVAEG